MRSSTSKKQTNEQPAPISSRERRRRRAIAAAYQVFREKGYERSGLQEIADVAEFSVPTLYNHFGSKRQLLGAVVDSCLEEVSARIEGQSYPDSSDAAELLVERQLQVQLTLIELLSPKLWMDVHLHYYLDPETAPKAREMDNFFIRQTRLCLQEMQERGLIRGDLDLEPLANLIDLATYDVAREKIPLGDISADALRQGLDRLLRPLVQLMQP